MNTLTTNIASYLIFCKTQKRLDAKTIKAYRIDLRQFSECLKTDDVTNITVNSIETFIASLHQTCKPKTAKRKIASVKAFFHYLEYRDLITINPFNKIQIKFREPVILPKIIPLPVLESLLRTIYGQHELAATSYQKRKTLQDIAIVELLFSTGIRISELCLLKASDVDLLDNTILIFGKGAKERRIQIENADVLNILREYHDCFCDLIAESGYFFTNRTGQPVSDQYVRKMLNKYTSLAGINMHITPHMFRHTFATSLLDADVDIRYIQELLGHSSINVTEIYTHVTTAKQKDILKNKHPRREFHI
ncbi:MAG: tyrosine-type recombinase/integrase [Clostridium sp.]|nr:tyrosine-type recombinase/integrase [Clostridium sp.]MCM1458875.1 tyrosine-type recombinase/integrase [Bacteroides sp.]